MYPPALAAALSEHGVEAATVMDLGLAGQPDLDVLEAAAADERVLLTENVADFAALSADRFAGRDWSVVEPEIRSDWERGDGRNWETVRGYVQKGWEAARGTG